MEQKEKMTAADVKSTTSRVTAYEEGNYYSVETVLFHLRGEVVKIYDQELVVKPFRFDQHPMIKYHNGLSEPFLSEMILQRSSIVMSKQWNPS